MATEPQPTTSEQSTLKIEQCFLWDPDLSPALPSRTYALSAYQVAILAERTSWKAMMDSGWDLREGISTFLVLLFAGHGYIATNYIDLPQPIGSWCCKGLHYFVYTVHICYKQRKGFDLGQPDQKDKSLTRLSNQPE